MDLVLDTNIFRENFKMDSIHFQNLFDYLLKTNSKIVVPEIVILEVESLFERELLKRLNDYKKTSRSLRNWLFTSEYSENDIPPVEEAVASFMGFFKAKLKLDEESFFASKDEYLKEVQWRAIKHIKPCSERGEEFRDTILWLSVLDIAKSKDDSPIGFISNNTNEFSSDNKTSLHPVLEKDAMDANVKVHYYSSLQEFIKQHAQNIQSITRERVWSKIDETELSEYISDFIDNVYDEQIINYIENRDNQVTYCRVLNFTNELQPYEFFIYERTDGTLYIELVISGELEVEARLEIEHEQPEISYEYHPYGDEYERIPKYIRTTKIEKKTGYFYPEVNVTVGFILQNDEITINEVVDFELA